MEYELKETDTIHEKVYETYKELKKMLPLGFLKMKVISSQRYPVTHQSLLKKIENEKNLGISKIKQNSSSLHPLNQNIYLYSAEEGNNNINKQINKIKKLTNNNSVPNKLLEQKNNNKNLDSDVMPDFTEEPKNEDNNCHKPKQNENAKNTLEEEYYNNSNNQHLSERPKGYFCSNAISDIQMKSNIYLPRIIDRMKFNIPRNEREENGFVIKGRGIKNFGGDEYINNSKNNIRHFPDKPTKLEFFESKKYRPTNNYVSDSPRDLKFNFDSNKNSYLDTPQQNNTNNPVEYYNDGRTVSTLGPSSKPSNKNKQMIKPKINHNLK